MSKFSTTMTVNELIAALQQMKKEGLGKARVLLATDDEGNSFRDCVFAPTPYDTSDESELEQMKEWCSIPQNINQGDLVITLG